MAEVTPFQFDKDKYEQTKEIYISILASLGVENPEGFLEAKISQIPEKDRNGLMFNKIVDSLFVNEQNQNDDKAKDALRRERAKVALEKAKSDKTISPYVVAYLAEMSDAYIPFDTVLTAGKIVGDGKSLQMGCGEGKTGVLSMAAYAKLQNAERKGENKQIFLTSSTSILAAEALDKLVFYDNVGMADKVTLITSTEIVRAKIDEKTGRLQLDENGRPETVTIDLTDKTEEERKQLLEEAYKSPLVSSDNATLMQHAMKGYMPEPEENVSRELLADEADFVLLDSYRPLQRTEKMTQSEISSAKTGRNLAYQILNSVKSQKGIYVKDDDNQYVDFTQEGRQAIVEEINRRLGDNTSIDKNQIFDYVYDALVVETVYKENRDYQILNDGKKIVSEDRASGVSIDLPEGVKQALEIKLQQEGKYVGEISEERKVLDTLNVQSFFTEYFNGRKHFVSGTLGLDSDEIKRELEDNFRVSARQGDIYEIPPKGRGQRDDQGKNMYRSQEEKRVAIIDNALQEIQSGRPVLIGAVSEQEINALKKELESRGLGDKLPRVLEYTAASEDIFKEDKANLSNEDFSKKYGVNKDDYGKYSDLIKKESGKGNVITLGTSIIGRGTTIKTSKEINGMGGIHVIIDGLHETSSRNQEQYKARTARGSDKGTTKEFFSLEDIPEEYRSEFEDRINDPEGVYKDVYKKIDERTSSIRNYVVQFVKETRDQINGIEEDTYNLSEAEKQEIKSLITARAFSIKNRACGVSDRFEDNIANYSREIEAYARMYRAKYSQKGLEFDETKWLKDNGFEDIAKVHIPFSKERQEQIFTLAGIKQKACEAMTPMVQGTIAETREMATPTKERDSMMQEGGTRDD